MASMGDPNDEAISGHRLYDKRLRGALWAAVVTDSELVRQIANINQVHPRYNPRRFDDLVHHILRLKECTIEVVAVDVRLHRVPGPTAQAALRSLQR